MSQATILATEPITTDAGMQTKAADGNDSAKRSEWARELSEAGVERFHAGELDECVRLMEAALRLEESGERWNDWAAAQLARGSATESEQGFRRALEMDGGHSQAAANLGVLLASQERNLEAIHYIESALAGIATEQRAELNSVLTRCRRRLRELGMEDAGNERV
jgi:Flp pilus assembly protein TadD